MAEITKPIVLDETGKRIADALEKENDRIKLMAAAFEQKADKSDLATKADKNETSEKFNDLQNQINNLPEGTTIDEVVQARSSDDGAVYGNLKSRLDSERKSVKNDISETADGFNYFTGTFENKEFSTSTNEFVDSIHWKSCFFKLEDDVFFKVKDNTSYLVLGLVKEGENYVYNRDISLTIGNVTAKTGGQAYVEADMSDIYVVIQFRRGWENVSNIPVSELATIYSKSKVRNALENIESNKFSNELKLTFDYGDLISGEQVRYNTSHTRLRTRKFQPKTMLSVKINEKYACRYISEDKSGTPITSSPWFTTDFIISDPDLTYRLCIKKSDSSEFTDEEKDNFTGISAYSYNAEKSVDFAAFDSGLLQKNLVFENGDYNNSEYIDSVKTKRCLIRADEFTMIELKENVLLRVLCGDINSENEFIYNRDMTLTFGILNGVEGGTHIINADMYGAYALILISRRNEDISVIGIDELATFYTKSQTSERISELSTKCFDNNYPLTYDFGDVISGSEKVKYNASKARIRSLRFTAYCDLNVEISAGHQYRYTVETETGVPVYSSSWLTDKNIIPKSENIYRLIVKKNDGSVFTDEELATFNILKVYKSQDSAQPQDDVPDYVVSETERVIEAVKQLQNSDTFSFIFMTDLHHAMTGINHGLYAVDQICKNLRIEAFVLGGDYIISNTTKDIFLNEYKDLNDSLQSISLNCPIIPIKGNHDDNTASLSYADSMQNSELFSAFYNLYQKDLNRNAEDRDGLYGYYDLPLYKTRLVFLNNHDFVFTNNNGVPSKKSDNYPSFSEEQLTWFSDILSGLPEGWKVITFGHEVIVSNSIHSLYLNYKTEIYNILKEKTSNGNITPIMHVCGHLHADISEKVDGFNTIITTAAWASKNNVPSMDGVIYSATAGTEKETAFDIYTVNLKDRTIKTTRYGYGIDNRTFTF